MPTARREPVELPRAVVDAVETPQERDLVRHTMAPIPAHLGQHERLNPHGPHRLGFDRGGHQVGHHRAHDGQADQQSSHQPSCSENLVHHEVNRVGAPSGTPDRRRLVIHRPDPLKGGTDRPEQHQSDRDIRAQPTHKREQR